METQPETEVSPDPSSAGPAWLHPQSGLGDPACPQDGPLSFPQWTRCLLNVHLLCFSPLLLTAQGNTFPLPTGWLPTAQPAWFFQLDQKQPAAEAINPWGPWGSFRGSRGENGSLSRLCRDWKPQAASLTGHERIQAGTVVSRTPGFGFHSPIFQGCSCWPATLSCSVM